MTSHSLDSLQEKQFIDAGSSDDDFSERLVDLCYEEPDELFLYEHSGRFREGEVNIDVESVKYSEQDELFTAIVIVTGDYLDSGGGCPDLPRVDPFKEKYKLEYSKGASSISVDVLPCSDAAAYYPQEYGM